MKRISLMSIVLLFGCSNIVSSLNAIGVAAKVEISGTQGTSPSSSSSDLQAILDQEEGPRVQFFLDLLKAEEMSDDDFNAWYNNLNEGDQIMVQYLTQKGVIDEIKAIKEGATGVSTTRKIARGIALICGIILGCNEAKSDEKTTQLDYICYSALYMSALWNLEEIIAWCCKNAKWLWQQEATVSARFQKIVQDAEATFQNAKATITNAKATYSEL